MKVMPLKRQNLFLLALILICLQANTQVMPFGMLQERAAVTDPGYVIGDAAEGGIVFYVAPVPTDLNADGILDFGLVCSFETTQLRWNNGTQFVTGATDNAIGAGSANTATIISAQGVAVAYAARWAGEYSGGDFTDWFLPSLYELNELSQNQDIVSASLVSNGGAALQGGFTWSSTQSSTNQTRAWNIWLMSGACPTCGGLSERNSNNVYYVRAIRAY